MPGSTEFALGETLCFGPHTAAIKRQLAVAVDTFQMAPGCENVSCAADSLISLSSWHGYPPFCYSEEAGGNLSWAGKLLKTELAVSFLPASLRKRKWFHKPNAVILSSNLGIMTKIVGDVYEKFLLPGISLVRELSFQSSDSSASKLRLTQFIIICFNCYILYRQWFWVGVWIIWTESKAYLYPFGGIMMFLICHLQHTFNSDPERLSLNCVKKAVFHIQLMCLLCFFNVEQESMEILVLNSTMVAHQLKRQC